MCSNGGGTADGQLAFGSVIFRIRNGRLRAIGIVRPQQPFEPGVHVPIVSAEILSGRVIAHEAWYGTRDGTCCASGVVRTVWLYAHETLCPSRTIVVRRPKRQSS